MFESEVLLHIDFAKDEKVPHFCLPETPTRSRNS